MKLKFLASIFFLFALNHTYAQNTWHKCGFDHAIQQFEQQQPGYKQHIDAVFDEATRLGLQSQYNRVIHTIPVAVHVVWKTPNEKLSECTISEQIEILNEDFRRQNTDAGNLRPIFNSIAADTEIEFRLDTIIWTQSNVDFATLGPFGGLFPDPTSIDSVKGTSLPLDPDQYLNIWTLNLGSGGLLGYAYPPDSLPNWPAGASAPSKNREGVVLHYEVLGGPKTFTLAGALGGPPTVLNVQGRTAVHEVGHYLGLRHIWGDGTTGGLFPQPSCSVDDGIGDTPNCLDRSSFDCDTTKNSCDTTLLNDLPDMVENYMDYSSESCMNSFTTGQKTLMKGVLNGPRAGLATTPIKVRPAYDAVYNAQVLAVSTANTCTSTFAASNLNASISIPDAPCMGTVANDVWFSFTATSSDLILEVTNITNIAGASTAMAYELFGGTCDSLSSLGCGNAGNNPLSGLNAGAVYYLRVYSMSTADVHNFDICLRNNNIVSTHQIEQILSQSVHLAPNPTSGNINIEIDNNISFEGFLTVKNLLGQTITPPIAIDNNNRQYTLSLANESNGLYLMEFRMNNHTIIKKVLLQK
ncbi:MAG: T9SS C-terminal target domain-containing protein [uncultured Aureispira sp.]|uniref:T9SS C-terminal target domain-containing protein n=1 Tax=uncultured Aureispira sp. TaxID=1331704 RepID=A0A6S6TM87_9BACT|nr:MAG: T9SS C-terminal target domain-containing protein [uncultured Aureispira sp.]